MAVEAPDTSGLSALERENRRLQRAVQELSVLNDLARAIGASRNSEQVMKTIVGRSLRAVGAQQGVITLVGPSLSSNGNTLVR